MARTKSNAALNPVETELEQTATVTAIAEIHRDAANHQVAVRATLGEVTIYNRTEALTRIRGLMAAGAQVMLELGKALTWLRENEPEADFRDAMDQLGMDSRTAYRCMQAARKFVLALPDGSSEAFENLSRGKLYELLVLDDEEVSELAAGGTVAGLKLDDIDTMSTSELRRTLRQERAKAKAELDTKERQINAKNEHNDKLEAELDKLTHGGKDTEKRLAHEREQNAIKTFQDSSLELLGAIQKFDVAVADCLAEPTEARVTLTEQTVTWLFQRIAQIATDRGMPVDFAAIVDPLKLGGTEAMTEDKWPFPTDTRTKAKAGA